MGKTAAGRLATRCVAGLCAIGLPALVSAPPASAFHFVTFEVEADVQSNPQGLGVQSLTVRLDEPVPLNEPGLSPGARFLFEIESGPNDKDGRSFNSADFSCIVPAEGDSCTVAYANDDGERGTDTIRVWHDSDGNPVDNRCGEVDCTEGRYAGPSDCLGSDPPACQSGEAIPGSGGERDRTDVVSVTWGPEPDTTAPSVTLDQPTTPTNNSTPTFTGSGDPGLPVTVTVKDAAGNQVQSLSANPDSGDGRYSVQATSQLADGDYTVQASQTDEADNTGKSPVRDVTVDTRAPEITLDQPDSPITGHTVTLSGTAGTAQGDSEQVVVRVYEGKSAAGNPVKEVTTQRQGDGSYSVEVTIRRGRSYTAQAEQKDAAGNRGLSQESTFR